MEPTAPPFQLQPHYLRGLSPIQVLARLPEKDERYRLEEAGLRAGLGEVRQAFPVAH